MKKPVFFITIIFFIIIILSIVQVSISNSLSTTGIQLSKLEKEIAVYKRDNTLLREEVLSDSSLYNIASKASEMGFVEAKSRVYIGAPLPLAVRP
ncbi:MAG: hypothetical protein HYT10_01585 [Candidatus Levybacteria bacterium]|nr:hypothetical protein [Candidatus Levybacteria bacterium]